MTDRISGKIDDRWSTPPLKASWFEDGEEPADNALKAASSSTSLAAEQMTVADFFDLLAVDETPSG